VGLVPGKPRRIEWEAQYVSEFVQKYYPGSIRMLHVKIGGYPPGFKSEDLEDAERQMLRVYLRWADAVVVTPSEVIIVEAKLRPTEYLKALGELEMYLKLVPATEELTTYLPSRILLGQICVPIDDPIVANMCRERKLRYTVFQPSFWKEYWQMLAARTRRPSLVGA